MTEQAALSQLREAYRGTGLDVRFYPDCCTILRWHLGRNGDGQHFALIAYGSTPGRLLKCPATAAGLESPTGPPNFFSALCGNRVGFSGDEVQALCDEILPPLSLVGEANSLEASGSDASELP